MNKYLLRAVAQQWSLLNPFQPLIEDGNTFAWYDVSDLATITKTEAGLVSLWANKITGGKDLVQATEAAQPVWSATEGITFNSASEDDKLSIGAITAVAQPTCVYILIKLSLSAIAGRRVLDFGGTTKPILGTTSLRGLQIYNNASGYLPSNYYADLGSWVIIRSFFNGNDTKLQINGSTPTTGAGTPTAMTNFTVGNRSDATASGAKISVKEIIIRKIADTAENEAIIYNYLFSKIKEIVIIGDSTTAYSPTAVWKAIVELMAYNKSFIDNSAGSSTIALQKVLLQATATIKTNAVIIMIGLNDLAMTSPQIIAAYQDLVDTARGLIGASNKIIIATMIPCNLKADQQYIDLNEAIRGNGATPITGVDARIDTTLTALNDGSGGLAAIYDTGDHLHENDLGRQIIADLYDAQLVAFGIS